jgi:hypothetical protein
MTPDYTSIPIVSRARRALKNLPPQNKQRNERNNNNRKERR